MIKNKITTIKENIKNLCSGIAEFIKSFFKSIGEGITKSATGSQLGIHIGVCIKNLCIRLDVIVDAVVGQHGCLVLAQRRLKVVVRICIEPMNCCVVGNEFSRCWIVNTVACTQRIGSDTCNRGHADHSGRCGGGTGK